MADPNPPKYLASVTIVAGANQIRADDSGAAFDITIDPGDYYISGDGTASDLLDEIEGELNGNGTDTWALSISGGKVSIECDAAWSVDWSDTTNTTFDGAILGFDTSADSSAGAGVSVEADYQHQYGFYPAHPVLNDTERTYASPVVQVESQGVTFNTYTAGEHRYLREITHLAEPSYKTYVDSSYTNESFYSFYQLIRDGRELRFYPDSAVTGTYDTLYPELSTMRRFTPERYSQGLNLYNWSTLLLEKK